MKIKNYFYKNYFYLSVLLCFFTQNSFCLTEKGHLIHYLRKKAKQERKCYQQTNFYTENKREIHRLAKIIARERRIQQRRKIGQAQTESFYPIFERQNAFLFTFQEDSSMPELRLNNILQD